MTALVVDDNVHMRRLMVDILSAFGVGKVLDAADGLDAYYLLRTNDVDVVLCDWVMQNLSGIDLLREVRKQDAEVRNPDVAFIMMSAHADDWRAVQARDAGVTTFLVKPFSTAALYERLQNIASGNPVDAMPSPADAVGGVS